MSFHRKFDSQYSINGHSLSQSSHCKDLGVIFSNTLSWREHYEMITSKAYKSLGLLHRVFKNSHCPEARKCLYISIVRPNLLYCSLLWRPYLIKDIDLLERVRRRATKFILSDYSSDYKTRLIQLGTLPLIRGGSRVSERGANHSSGSLKQGVWGAQPPRIYRIFCFMKYRNAT